MSGLNFCLEVLWHVEACIPPKDDPLFRKWHDDKGRAYRAVSDARAGRLRKAVRLADQLARRYNFRS